MTWSPAPTRKHIECTPFDTRGPKRLWDAPAGVVQRARGDVGRLVAHDYLCPVHGRFEVQVPSSDVPDEVACESTAPRYAGQMACCECLRLHEPNQGIIRCADCGQDVDTALWCGASSPWSPGVVNVWKSSGEVTS